MCAMKKKFLTNLHEIPINYANKSFFCSKDKIRERQRERERERERERIRTFTFIIQCQ